jgi:hypothetical protein
MANQLAAVVPSDTVALSTPAGSLYVGVGGDISLATVQDGVANAVVFKAVPSNSWLNLPGGLKIGFVKASGTSATSIVACVGDNTYAKP